MLIIYEGFFGCLKKFLVSKEFLIDLNYEEEFIYFYNLCFKGDKNIEYIFDKYFYKK